MLLDGEILIDCGVPFSALEPYYKRLRLVLLTHQHGDHFAPATIKRLHLHRPALRFVVAPWMLGYMTKLGISRMVVDCCTPGVSSLRYGDFSEISNDEIPHDVPNCAWRIVKDGERAFYATDCGTLDGVEAKGYDLYLIEANHTREELEKRLADKEAAGVFAYERRAALTHLSREQADEWLAENADFGKSRVFYLHGHREKEV